MSAFVTKTTVKEAMKDRRAKPEDLRIEPWMIYGLQLISELAQADKPLCSYLKGGKR